jgi:hypothetical protein
VTSRISAPSQHADRGLDGLRHGFARSHSLIAVALYAVGAIIIQRHAVEHLGTTTSGSWLGSDSTQFMWAMWWWPHAILRGLNPFVTHLLWVPDAYNLASVTSSPLPAIALAPLTALAGPIHGPIVAYNIANLTAPVINAWCAYRLCLYLTRVPGASILGGWLYGFSTYGLSPLQGHLQLVFTFAAPAMVLLTVRLYRGDVSRLRFIFLASLVLACQALCGTEILFTGTVMGVVVLASAICFSPRNRLSIVALIPPLVAAYLLMAFICSPFFWYALTGPKVQAAVGAASPADLLSFVIPTPMTWLGGSSFTSVSSGYVANIGEEGTYLGLPLIAIAIAYWSQSFRRPATKVLMSATLVAAVWSLGGVLSVDGHPTISLPWKLVASTKPFDEVLPVRVGLYIALGTAVTAALWLAAPGSSRRRWLLGLVAAVFLLPNVDAVASGHRVFEKRYVSPAFISDGSYRRYLHHDEVILPLPFGPLGNSLLWQAQSQGYFRMASGWFGYYPPDYSTSRVVAQMSRFAPFTDPVLGMRWFLIAHGVGAVVMASGQGGPWPQVMSQLGLRRVSVDGVWLYQLPRSWRSRS